MTAESHQAAFYDRHWEHTSTAADPHIVAKGDLVLRLVPAGVRTIVDIGCGDGYLTHRLAEHHQVTAVDRSQVALQRLRRLRAPDLAGVIEASADAIPLPDRAADLVFSSQMLEHLPEDVLRGAAREMQRLADRHLLVTVPHRETLRRRYARCSACGLEFHIDGHLHAFDAAALDRLFPDFERVHTEFAGPLEPPAYTSVEWLRQHLCRHWWMWDSLKIACPRCGETSLRKPRRGPLRRAAERGLDRFTEFWSRREGRVPEPYWIITLYRRKAST
ncbi:class I SAM-dependent methyltransferase [Chondromyces apiculatus]|uniref:class I SAM-dependent methyltransferase n=1 Tax=Chondromyces apiculatus TaxID=51 RepID=UPI0012DE4AFD|nr:class I SAM-dependent methyltransferase [Chondromyces apiculatus]